MIFHSKLLPKADIKLLSAPKYEEISVTKLWPELKKDANLSVFFPDFSKGQIPSFDFFWTVIDIFF
jgi:hypothetical protein